MANIKFMKKFASYMKNNGIVLGNRIYFTKENGNRISAYCADTHVSLRVINKIDGAIDNIELPFENYFEPTQCSEGSPKWYQHIDGNYWYFEKNYKHVLPKDSDYKKLANAIDEYIELW